MHRTTEAEAAGTADEDFGDIALARQAENVIRELAAGEGDGLTAEALCETHGFTEAGLGGIA